MAQQTERKERLRRPCARSAGSRKDRARITKAERQNPFAVAKVEPKQHDRGIPRARPTSNLIEVGTEITSQPLHQGSDGRRHRQQARARVSQGAMKRWNFGGLRATHGVSGHPTARTVRPASARTRQGVQGQEDGRPPWATSASPRSTWKWSRPTPKRGCCWSAAQFRIPGGWVFVRDAVKRPLPKGCAEAGRLPQVSHSSGAGSLPPKLRRRRHEGDHYDTRCGTAGDIELKDESSA